VAVRSSATAEDSAIASFAGVHESFLNIREFSNILKAIKGCYASLWTPRAVAYRRKIGLTDNEVAAAVVIMELIPAEAAGVAFSCDPLTGRRDRIAITANFGLGESVVSGSIEPDHTCYIQYRHYQRSYIGKSAARSNIRGSNLNPVRNLPPR